MITNRLGYRFGRHVDKYDFVVEFNFHLGELYFMAPVLYHLFRRDRKKKSFGWWPKSRPFARICILFTNRQVWENYQKDILLLTAIQAIGCDIYCYFSGEHDSNICVQEEDCYRILENAAVLLSHIGSSVAKNMVREFDQSKPKVVLFPHTSSPALFDINSAANLNLKQRSRDTSEVLVLDEVSGAYYALQGLTHSIPLGYHMLAEPWQNLISDVIAEEKLDLAKANPFALIFSYGAREDVITEQQWIELHVSTYRTIRRVFPNLDIVLKPHPSQSEEKLRNLIEQQEMQGVSVSLENPSFLAKQASLSISYLTGGIFNALYAGTPAINYFNAYDTYENAHGGNKHNFAAIGVADTQTEIGLEQWLLGIKLGTKDNHFRRAKLELPMIETSDDLLARIS